VIRSMLITAALAVGACSMEPGETLTEVKPAPTAVTTPKEDPVKTTPKAQTFEMQISDMTCPNCTRAVTGLLQGVNGVESAQVDLESGKAVVKVKPGAKVDEAMLTAAVAGDYPVESCKKVSN
jgi:copper chaperone CopZ